MALLFSLILPVYKVELYIEKCLRSCLDQVDIAPSEYEVILVDDGSPDKSIEIAMEVVKDYPNHNVQIVHRDNGGLSAARNTGITKATGQYLWFIDSDDWIAKNALSLLKKKLEIIGGVEVLSFSHKLVLGEEDVQTTSINGPGYSSDGFDFLAQNNFLSACTRLYCTQFLREQCLTFAEGYLWEDAQFNIRLFPFVKRHCYFDASLYYYLRRENSITTGGISEKMESSRFYLIDSVLNALQPCELTKRQQQIINQKLSVFLLSAIVGIGELPKDLSLKYKQVYSENRMCYLRLLLKSGSLRYRMIATLLTINFNVVQKILTYKLQKKLVL